MAQKKDSTWRFYIDYRNLMLLYVVMHIHFHASILLLTPAVATYFTTLDLASGYWQVAVEEKDKGKTDFSTSDGTLNIM